MFGRWITALAARLDRVLPDNAYPRRYPWRKLYFAVAVLADMLMVTCACAASYGLTFHVIGRQPVGAHYPAALIILLVTAFLALKACGRYEDRRLMYAGSDLGEVVKALLAAFAVSVILLFGIKGLHVSRMFLGLYLLLSLFLVTLARRQLKRLRMRLRSAGLDLTRAIIVGHNQTADRLLQRLSSHPDWPLTPVAVVGNEWKERRRHDVKVLRHERGLVRYIKAARADEVIICKPDAPLAELAGTLATLKRLGIRSRVVSRSFSVLREKLGLQFDEIDGIPIIDYALRPFHGGRAAVKRAVDIVGAGLILILGLPLWLAIAAGVLVTSGRPLIFTQERVGSGGRTFPMFKFRTMRNGGGANGDAPGGSGNVMRGPMFKSPGDARVTWLGKWLRRFSLDEVPQMVNVLVGHMSLVGPRPPLPDEVAEYESWHRERLSGRVGITGMWQIFGRDLLEFDQVALMDIYYLSQGSLFLDYRILLRTAGVVLAGRPDPRERAG